MDDPLFAIHFWTIACAGACAVSCSLLGCFLMLKRMSLMGDAIGHGILPGIALAVLMTGYLGSFYILIGAMIFGLLTAVLAQTLTSIGKVSEDASLGVVFPSLFAFGVLLISQRLRQVDIDIGCVFYGMLESVPLRTIQGTSIPVLFPNLFWMLLITVAFVFLFWKEMKIATFDAQLSSAMGYPAWLIHYLFIAVVAGCTVTAFSVVGSILVLAMFIVPAATAYMLCDRLPWMLFVSTIVGITSTIIGYALALYFGSNIGGMIAVVAGGNFVLATFAGFRHGILAKIVRNFRLGLRIAREEILAQLYRSEEKNSKAEIDLRDHPTSSWMIDLSRRQLFRAGFIAAGPEDSLKLTDRGRRYAESVVRAHRLWETYLDENFDLPLDHLHAPASRAEHFIGPQLQEELERSLQTPGRDPHGSAIPPAG